MFLHPANWVVAYTDINDSPDPILLNQPPTPVSPTSFLPRLRIAKACDQCRKRRAKCSYNARDSNDLSLACTKCKAKGLNCTFEYWKAKKEKELHHKSTSRKVQPSSAEYTSGAQLVISSFRRDDILPQAERELITSQLNAQLCGSLLQYQQRCIKTPLAEFCYPNILNRFFQVGGRLNQLSCAEEQIAAAGLMYIGSRYSPHSAIVGPESSHKKYEFYFDLKLNSTDGDTAKLQDFYTCGIARETFCASILDFAVKKCDEVGLLRKPTIESLVTLLTLEAVVDSLDYTCKVGRPYIFAAASHLRTCLELGLRLEIVRRLLPFVLGRDAFSAVASGDASALTEDDIKVMFWKYPYGVDIFLLPSPSSSSHQRKLDNLARFRNEVNLDDQYIILTSRVAVLTRFLIKNWTSPLARQRFGNEATRLRRFWAFVKDVQDDQATFHNRLKNSRLGPSPINYPDSLSINVIIHISRTVCIAHRGLFARLVASRKYREKLLQGGLDREEGVMKREEVEKRIKDLEELMTTSEAHVQQEIKNVFACLKILHDDAAIIDRLRTGAMIRMAFVCLCFVPDLRERFRAVAESLPPDILSAALHLFRCGGFSYGDVKPIIQIMENMRRVSPTQVDLRGSEASHVIPEGNESLSGRSTLSTSTPRSPAVNDPAPKDNQPIRYPIADCTVIEDASSITDFTLSEAERIRAYYMGTMGDMAHLVFPNSYTPENTANPR